MMVKDMRRVEMEDLVKYLDDMIYDLEVEKRHDEIDRYEMVRHLEMIARKVIHADADLGDRMQDLEDEARNAYHYQEIYRDALHHAEGHITWLEEEFADDISECDKYERDC